MLSASEYQQVNRLTGGAAHAWFKPRFRGPADRGHCGAVPQRASRSAVRCATVTTWQAGPRQAAAPHHPRTARPPMLQQTSKGGVCRRCDWRTASLMVR
jgi:hypothetical protein